MNKLISTYIKHKDSIIKLGMKYVKSKENAEDMYSSLFFHLKDVDVNTVKYYKSFLYRSYINLCHNYRRTKKISMLQVTDIESNDGFLYDKLQNNYILEDVIIQRDMLYWINNNKKILSKKQKEGLEIFYSDYNVSSDIPKYESYKTNCRLSRQKLIELYKKEQCHGSL